MKRKSIIAAAILAIGFFATSCSSDNNDGETLAPIVGKWQIVKVGTVIAGKEELIDAPQNESGCDHDFLELKIGSTAEEGDYGKDCVLTTTTGSYDRTKSTLKVTINGVTTTSDIVNLTLSELKLKNSLGIISVYIR